MVNVGNGAGVHSGAKTMQQGDGSCSGSEIVSEYGRQCPHGKKATLADIAEYRAHPKRQTLVEGLRIIIGSTLNREIVI